MHQKSLTLSIAAALAPFSLLLPLAAQDPATSAASAPATTKALPAELQAGARTIHKDDLFRWLSKLTSEEFGGRGTGQEGFRLAAEMVASHFAALGLEPVGDEVEGNKTYWQQVPWSSTVPKVDTTAITFHLADGQMLRIGLDDGLGGSAGENLDAEGEAVWLMVDAANADLSNQDLKGKVVFVQGRGGFAALGQQGRGSAAQRVMFQLRASLLRSAPAAVIYVDDELHRSAPRILGQGGPQRGANPAAGGRGRFPIQLFLHSDVFTKVLEAAGLTTEAAGTSGVRATVLEGTRASVAVQLEQKDAPAYNVVGILRGSDPVLNQEYVVIGSHLDHLGRRGDVFFPGADDDGSGTVGVMALARAFAAMEVKPRRSVMFVTFCGEENGLIGSNYFTRHPPVPLSSMVAELQMDMIGRDEEHVPGENPTGETAEENKNSLHLIGTQRLSMDLHELCMRMNAEHGGFDLEFDQESVYSRSDHYNFARFGVPIAFFFTGFHRDYHKTTDTIEKINFDKLQRIITYVYTIAFALAQQDGRPLIDPELWKKSGNRAEPAAPMRTERKNEGGDSGR